MEKVGFLRREFIADGRRKQVLFLTNKGVDLHGAVWQTYHDAMQDMQDMLADRVSSYEAYEAALTLIKQLPDGEFLGRKQD